MRGLFIISIKQGEIKVGHRAFDLHLFIRSHSTYLAYTSDARLFNFHESKPAMVQVSLTFSKNSNQTYFHMPQIQEYLISLKKQNQKLHSVHVNYSASSHSSQYDFIVHGLVLGPFNFHQRKENQNTRYNAFEPHLSMHFHQNPHPVHVNFNTSSHSLGLFNFHETKQIKPTFNVRKSHYFITLKSNYLDRAQTDAQII